MHRDNCVISLTMPTITAHFVNSKSLHTAKYQTKTFSWEEAVLLTISWINSLRKFIQLTQWGMDAPYIN